jgi:hypothetical protein
MPDGVGAASLRPTATTTDTELDATAREEALQRIRKRRELGAQVVVYIPINAALWGIWAFTGEGYPWPAWVSGFWGAALLINVWDVMLPRPITEADVRARWSASAPSGSRGDARDQRVALGDGAARPR